MPLGVSVSGTSQAETIDLAASLGIFSAVQATWNLHERAAGDALAAERAEGDRQGGRWRTAGSRRGTRRRWPWRWRSRGRTWC